MKEQPVADCRRATLAAVTCVISIVGVTALCVTSACLVFLCARSTRSTPRGRTSAPDNIGQAQSRQASWSPTRIASESVLARGCTPCRSAAQISAPSCTRPRIWAPGVWRSPLLKCGMASGAQICSQQRSVESPDDGHGLRRPACCSPPPTPGEPEEMVWAGSVASLFVAATRSAPLSKPCRDARTALHSRRRTLGRDCVNPASESTAAGRRNCFFLSLGSTHEYPAACCPPVPLHISLATILKDHLGLQCPPITRPDKRARTLGGHVSVRRGRQPKSRTSFVSGVCGWSREGCFLQHQTHMTLAGSDFGIVNSVQPPGA